MSKRFIKPPYSISRATSIDSDCRIVVAYPRPAFSSTKRTNHAPISFNQQAQVSQGHTSYRNTEVHSDGGLELVKPAREPASSRPKSCAFLKKPHESSPFAASCRPLQEENRPWSEIRFSLRNLPVRVFDSRAQGFSTSLASRRSNCPPPSPNLVHTHPIEHYQAFCDSVPRLSRAATPTEGNQIGASSKEARTWEHHLQPTIPPPRLHRLAESRRQPIGCIFRG